MHRNIPSCRRAALAAALVGLTSAGGADAALVTGRGAPLTTLQPSLTVNYLIRTQDPTNFGDIGEVVMSADGVVPGGFAVANGQLLSIASNPALFSRIGTTYGGDGRTTFALPNLSGRMVVGTGSGPGLTPRNLGSLAGASYQTLTVSQLPPYGGASGVSMGSVPFPTAQPSIALNQSIVVQGAYPLASGAQSQTPVIGQVLTFAGTPLSNQQLPADGRQLPISPNAALFSVVGNTYGGTPPVTFDLPNLSGRAATEAGISPYLPPHALGQTEGAESTLISLANLPPQDVTLANGMTAIRGGDQPINIQAPTLGLHYIIAEQGAYPQAGVDVPDGVPFLGEISLFAGDVAPAGWAFADGQFLAINQYQALFSVLGTTFGGIGFSTFELPDLRDRVAVGVGDGSVLGDTFGADSVTLLYEQLPVGYPSALPTANVPEPPAFAVLLVALAGLAVWRGRARRDPVASWSPTMQSRTAKVPAGFCQCLGFITGVVNKNNLRL